LISNIMSLDYNCNIRGCSSPDYQAYKVLSKVRKDILLVICPFHT